MKQIARQARVAGEAYVRWALRAEETEIAVDITVENAVAYLSTKYEFDLLILYGSYANGHNNNESDIDIIGFAEITEFVHESPIINDHMLDAWIYPISFISDVSKTIHILPCQILIDKSFQGAKLIQSIEDERKKNTKKLSGNEKEQMDKWIEKMIKRARQDSPEANYRYNWLLNDFPELYCNYSGFYYDGPIKTIKNRLSVDKEIGELYFDIMGHNKSIDRVEELYKKLLSRSI